MRAATQASRQKEGSPTKTSTRTVSSGDRLPFYLRSEKLQQEKQERMKELQKLKEEEQRKMSEFHALPVLKSPPPQINKSNKPLTQPKPFHLESDDRHEQHQKALQAKLEEEKVEQELLAQHLARKIPPGVYNPTTVVPTHPSPVKPTSPNLHSSKRVQERKANDERAARILEAAQHGASEEAETTVLPSNEGEEGATGILSSPGWENVSDEDDNTGWNAATDAEANRKEVADIEL